MCGNLTVTTKVHVLLYFCTQSLLFTLVMVNLFGGLLMEACGVIGETRQYEAIHMKVSPIAL